MSQNQNEISSINFDLTCGFSSLNQLVVYIILGQNSSQTFSIELGPRVVVHGVGPAALPQLAGRRRRRTLRPQLDPLLEGLLRPATRVLRPQGQGGDRRRPPHQAGPGSEAEGKQSSA